MNQPTFPKPCPLCASPVQIFPADPGFRISCIGCNLIITHNDEKLLLKTWNQRKKPAATKVHNTLHKSLTQKDIYNFPNDDTLLQDTEQITDKELFTDKNIHFRIARFIWAQMNKVYPENTNKHLRTAKANDWIDEIRLMLDVDKISVETIKSAAKWIYESNDDFWRYTIKSVTGFRKHIGSISIAAQKVKAAQNKTLNKSPNFFNESTPTPGAS